jgi:diguanylate cyclase (GGDEF)-like protein
MWQATRSGGMRIVDRLTRIAGDLSEVDPERRTPDWVADDLAGLAELGRDGVVRPIDGSIPAPARLTEAERTRLDTGAPLLRRSEAGDTLLILQRGARGSWLVGAVDPSTAFQLSVDADLPFGSDYAVFTSDGTRLAGSRADLRMIPADAVGERRITSRRIGSSTYEVMGWPVFLRAAFDHSDIQVVVAEREDLVLAPVAAFRTMLALIAVLALTMVALLSAALIRRRLVPLDRLREGTRRAAAGVLTCPVQISSDGEFGELATSFNEMMSRLDSQFRSLDRLIAIDRAILATSLRDPRIEEAFLEAFAELYPSGNVLLAIAAETGMVVYARGDSGETQRSTVISLGEQDRRWIASQAGPRRILRERVPESHRDALGVRTELFLFPLIAAGITYGFAVAVDPEPIALLPERRLWAEQACTQIAAALHGARLRDENERLLDFDPSSGLPNRARFLRELETVLARTRTSEGVCALMWISLDGLERIRDNVDIDAAQAAFQRLAGSLDSIPGAIVGRVHVAELAVLCEAPAAAAALELARRAWAAVRDASAREEGAHLLTVHGGVAAAPIDAEVASDLLHCAETALRHAKESREGALAFFSPELEGTIEARLRLERELPGAIRNGELRLFYQPIVELATRSLQGAEALVRWQHPERGLVAPDEFIPIAEETALVAELGRWVIDTACRDVRRWQLDGLPAIQVKVNISARHLAEYDLLADVRRALHDSGVSPGCLAIELTETAMLLDDPQILASLEALRELGIGISLDDFGTGYSSLGYLRRFPFDSLKIDRSFVSGLPDQEDDRAIVEVILVLARALGLDVVAEGIERESQLAHLQERGCPLGQGYLFDRPLPVESFEKRLREWEP